VVILSNSAQWLQLDESPYVQALLHHNEAEAVGIIDEMDDSFLAASNAYVGSKLALGQAIRRRAAIWGKAGVRLNGVAAGNTKTPMLQRILEDPNTRDGVQSMEIPLGRLAEPDEVAKLITFLCSPEASYIHGGIYYIDGGMDAHIRPDRF
jgi:NAD(P)-dependent dehydrogenase (short-subunit alcohol dehydrogenase family)